ncbi:unnamed protein product [marine sediment metagenome]|uniref:Carrier domain-containing protein n=1 Tax=marine sediment metagenome TaxID=412755 RepID=X1I096_9ZZZZ
MTRRSRLERGASPVEPRSPMEEKLVAIWRQILKLETIGVEDRFIDVGGDSLLATLLVTNIERELGVALSMLDMADASTIAEQAKIVEGLRNPLKRRS